MKRESSNWIIERLKELEVEFPGARFRYELRYARMHFIEVLPLEIFEDEEYMTYENDLYISFDTLFPNEDVLFISEESLNQINNDDNVLYSTGR